MYKKSLLSLCALVTIGISTPKTHALSCIQQTFTEQATAAASIAVVTPVQQLTSTPSGAGISFTWKTTVQTWYKNSLTDTEFVITDAVWTGGIEGESRLQKDMSYVVFLDENNTLGFCNYPRNVGTQPLTADEKRILEKYKTTPSRCAPYMCKDGTSFPACTEEGITIAYLVAPCSTHGGDKDEGEVNQTYGFSDVSVKHPYYQAISWAKAHNIIRGYTDGTFRPDATINRAEFLKILLEPVTAVCRAYYNYSDVDFNAWYGDYVQAASCQGLATGYADGSFKPAATINVAEAAKIIVLHNSQGAVKQATTADWYTPFISYLQLRNAFPASIEYANDQLTRSEMVEMMYKLAWYNQFSSSGFSNSSNTSSNQNNNLLFKVQQTGGLCPNSTCESSYTLNKDGTLTINMFNEHKVTIVDPAQINQIQALINALDPNEIMSHPFIGTCPRAYDATAFTYTIYKDSVPFVFDACEYKTDGAIFALIKTIIHTTSTQDLTTETGCLAAGGTWGAAGLFGTLSCNVPTKDAGKVCTDNSQCEAGCVYIGLEKAEADNVGQQGTCKAYTSPFGCWSYITNGVIKPGICVD